MGGLGNQLFMIFNGVSFAMDNNIDYKILSLVNKTYSGTETYWNTLLDAFKEKYGLVSEHLETYMEPYHHYVPIPSTISEQNYIIQGYFQSYKYFENNYDKFKQIMQLQQKIENVRNKYISILNDGKKTIAMHFRLGDYLGLQMYHYVQRPEYYVNALLQFEKDIQDKNENMHDYKILYFYEQKDAYLIAQYIHFIKNTTRFNCNFVPIDCNIPDWEQMLLMASCDHLIIANSTFSWWGAYFNENTQKQVYYPSIWFGPAYSDKNTNDMFPDTWKMISST